MVKKKPFIDKKKSVSFSVVHRSQHDPLVADNDAVQRVLAPIRNKHSTEHDDDGNDSNDDDWEDASDVDSNDGDAQAQQGIFYNDGYDYMKHMRPMSKDGGAIWLPSVDNSNNSNNKKTVSFRDDNGDVDTPDDLVRVTASGLKLPASVLPSEYEEDIGLLNRAAPHSGPRLDWDPEIVECLDDDFDADNPEWALEDDFISLAMADADKEPASSSSRERYGGVRHNTHHGYDCNDDDSDDKHGSCNSWGDDDDVDDDIEERKSRFTEYSMTSSVMHRSAGLQLLDERFEKIMEEYDSDELGPLEEDDPGIQGRNDVGRFEDMLDEVLLKDPTLGSEIDRARLARRVMLAKEDNDDSTSGTKSKIRLIKEQTWADLNKKEEWELVEVAQLGAERKWDCETIVSTYSNMDNHPSTITETPRRHLRIDPKTKLPVGVLEAHHRDIAKKRHNGNGGVEDNADDEDEDEQPGINLGASRPKNETADEKKMRKKQIKEERKQRRQEKKATKVAFKEEESKQMFNNIQRAKAPTGIAV